MEDEEAWRFLHSEYFVLVDKEGRIRSRKDDNGYQWCMMEQVNMKWVY